jgi:GAF domain-containing protein
MQSAETLADLQKFLTLLDPSLNLDEMLTDVARQLVEMFDVDHSGMLLFDANDDEGVVLAEYPAWGAVGLRVPLTNYPLLDQLKREPVPIFVFDAQHDPLMGSAQSTMQTLGIQSIVILPLVAQGRIMGSLSLDVTGSQRHFSPADLDLCHIIGDQIAVAVDYTFTLERVEQARQQAQRLREVNRVLSQSLDLDEVLHLILEQLDHVLPVDGSSIYLLTGDSVQLKAWRGNFTPIKPADIIPVKSLWGALEIVSSRQAVLVRNTETHPNWHVYKNPSILCWLGVPLIVKNEIVGLLNLNGCTINQFNESHIPLVTDFANQAAIAIHNAELYGQATKRAELLASIQEIGVSIVASLNLDEVLNTVSTSILDLLGAHHIRIFLYDSGTDSFTLASALGRGGDLRVVPVAPNPPRKNGLTYQVAHAGKTMSIADTSQHPLYQGFSQYAHFRAIIGVPLKKRQQVLGVITLSYPHPHKFTPDEIVALNLLATQAAVALENARLYQLEVKQIEQELAIARQIQQGFLPHEIPQVPGWNIAAICLPARETAGDFYEFVRRRDASWGLAIGDVSGKSIQAAMLMSAAQSVVASKGSDHRSPADVMTETNRLLFEDVPNGSFVAASYALLSPNDNRISFSNGGQLAPYLVPVEDSPLQLIETPGVHWPLGVLEEVGYQESTLTLHRSDLLVFFTDGLVERMNRHRRIFGFEGVASVLAQNRGKSAQAVIAALLQASDEFAGGLPAHDDVTLLIVQCMG